MHIKENSDGIRKSTVAEAGSKALLFVGIGKTLLFVYGSSRMQLSGSGRLFFSHHLMSAWETVTRRWLRTTTKFCFHLDPKPWNKVKKLHGDSSQGPEVAKAGGEKSQTGIVISLEKA